MAHEICLSLVRCRRSEFSIKREASLDDILINFSMAHASR